MTTTGLTIPFVGLKKQYHNLRSEILDTTDAVLRSGILMDGNYTYEFEHWLANRNRTRYARLCHSGTQALEIIAEFFNSSSFARPPTVVIPALTYPATANAWIRAGWNICILDTNSHGQINFKTLPNLLEYQAVCLVGLYGASVENHWPYFHDIVIVEDAAQHWLSQKCTRHGEAAAISFDPTKNLPNYGNGGAIVTNNYDLIDFARSWVSNGKYLNHADVGTNSRMSEIDCAQMMIKTRYIDQWQARRKEIAEFWNSRLEKSNVRSLIDSSNIRHHSFHKYVIEVDQRDILQRNLALRKIETKIHYKDPLQDLPAFQHFPGPDMLSASHALSRRCLSLPLYPELSDLEVEYVADQLLDCI
jgi:dTDP-4-amino-4,6-dideoxygalactose transaminase